MLSISVRIILLLVGIIFTTVAPSVFADGGVVLFKKAAEYFEITVFQSPAPLRAGISDFSVLIQSKETGRPILDCDIRFTATPVKADVSAKAWQPPCCSMQHSQDVTADLTRAHSKNRILYGALVALPQPGQWRVELLISHANTQCKIEHDITVAPPVSPLQAYWPLLLLPFMVGGLVGLYQWRSNGVIK